MSHLKLTLVFILVAAGVSAWGQTEAIAKITVEAGPVDRENTIVGIFLDHYPLRLENASLTMVELRGKAGIPLTSQLDLSEGVMLWWVLEGKTKAGAKRTYELRSGPIEEPTDPKVKTVRSDKVLTIQVNGKNALQYNFATVPPPEGVSRIYERSGFIHPLWSPQGEVLTRIQPPDHYHHVGLWNPWTHTEFAGREIDFWNLVKAQGTVKFNTLISTTSNQLYGGFRAIHDHIDLNAPTSQGSQVVLKEEWDVRVWNTGDGTDPGWIVDFTSTYNCATDSILTIKEYRYQGFGFRATEKWDDNTAQLLTSEGKNKGDGNATRARWCDIRGISDFGTSGILMMTHPSNYNFPEPIRIWPVGSNEGKENVFFNFNPTMDRDWILRPGYLYRLKYRMYIYDGTISPDRMESLWRDFADPPVVRIKKL